MTPANATVFPVYGQLYNFSGVIKSLTTGNALTGGLTGLAATISHNDGAPVATVNTPVELGSGTGIYTLDLTAAEMSYQKNVVTVTATNTNAIYSYTTILSLYLAQFSGRWDAQTVLRFEQLWKDLFIGMGLNGVSQTGASLLLLNEDGSTHVSSTVQQNTTSGARSKSN